MTKVIILYLNKESNGEQGQFMVNWNHLVILRIYGFSVPQKKLKIFSLNQINWKLIINYLENIDSKERVDNRSIGLPISHTKDIRIYIIFE